MIRVQTEMPWWYARTRVEAEFQQRLRRRTRAIRGTWWHTLRKDPCAYCCRRRKVTRDHVVPKSVGGTLVWDNVAPACSQCQRAKADRPLLLALIHPAWKASGAHFWKRRSTWQWRVS